MNIVCAESVNKSKEIFSDFGNCEILPDKKITKHDLKKTDALIIRSGTKVNAELLENTSVKFVGTATSGIDHIDTKYLEENNIYFCDAAGSNANSVSDYVISAIQYISTEKKINLEGKKIAIIGCGNVGITLIPKLKSLGLETLINDPPKAYSKTLQKDLLLQLESLDKILPEADIVTIHTPLVETGKWPTKNLVNKAFLDLMKKDSIFINTSRGGICDEDALLEVKKNNQIGYIVTDVWNNEPNYNVELCNQSIIATPHIAGHSYHAKLLGTLMCFRALNKYSKSEAIEYVDEGQFYLQCFIDIDMEKISSEEQALTKIISQTYNIIEDNNFMKNRKLKNSIVDPEREKKYIDSLDKTNFFNYMRQTYYRRSEFKDMEVNLLNASKEFESKLSNLGFKISGKHKRNKFDHLK